MFIPVGAEEIDCILKSMQRERERERSVRHEKCNDNTNCNNKQATTQDSPD